MVFVYEENNGNSAAVHGAERALHFTLLLQVI
jgi:hypothetical protein